MQLLDLRPRFKIRSMFRAYDARTGELLWQKGKNHCVICNDARRMILWQLFGYGDGAHDHPWHLKEWTKYWAMSPFCFLGLGDSVRAGIDTEDLDPTLCDLVSPLITKGETYAGNAEWGNPYAVGEWKLQDGCQVGEFNIGTQTVPIAEWFTFGTEDANDYTIREWGLFGIEAGNGSDVSDWRRRFLNRNHLDPSDQFLKTSTMILRVHVQILITYA